MSRPLLIRARALRQLFRPAGALTRCASTRRQQARPRHQEQRNFERSGLSRDPSTVVRTAHEKECNAFRYAIEDQDVAAAYEIYLGQRETPYLPGSDVTALMQLISADASLRRVFDHEQPESMKTVFWQVVEDVKEQRQQAHAMIWVHVIETLSTWDMPEKAEELWTWLQTLPNRVAVDKDAMCVDARIYGVVIKMRSKQGVPASELQKLHDEAIQTRKLEDTLMLAQAMVEAHFRDGNIGEAYKAMDEAITKFRRYIRSTFFTATMSLALDNGAVGIATEIFMKGCNIKRPPSSAQVTRLLIELGRSKDKDPMENVMKVFEKYREARGETMPSQNVNAVLGAMFASCRDQGIPAHEILDRVHGLIRKAAADGTSPSTATINILLSGYIELGQKELALDLLTQDQVHPNHNSFRSMLKGLSLKPPETTSPESNLADAQEIWALFTEFQKKQNSQFVPRDIKMIMRSALRIPTPESTTWVRQILEEHKPAFSEAEIEKLEQEFVSHISGTFKHHNVVHRRETGDGRL